VSTAPSISIATSSRSRLVLRRQITRAPFSFFAASAATLEKVPLASIATITHPSTNIASLASASLTSRLGGSGDRHTAATFVQATDAVLETA
jgi:hypothetical protein